MLTADYQLTSIVNTDDKKQVITFLIREVISSTREEEDTTGRLQRRPEDPKDWVRQVPGYSQIGSPEEVVIKRDSQLEYDEVIQLIEATVADIHPEYELVKDEELP